MNQKKKLKLKGCNNCVFWKFTNDKKEIKAKTILKNKGEIKKSKLLRTKYIKKLLNVDLKLYRSRE